METPEHVAALLCQEMNLFDKTESASIRRISTAVRQARLAGARAALAWARSQTADLVDNHGVKAEAVVSVLCAADPADILAAAPEG
jgi:hypothetical protein